MVLDWLFDQLVLPWLPEGKWRDAREKAKAARQDGAQPPRR